MKTMRKLDIVDWLKIRVKCSINGENADDLFDQFDFLIEQETFWLNNLKEINSELANAKKTPDIFEVLVVKHRLRVSMMRLRRCRAEYQTLHNKTFS